MYFVDIGFHTPLPLQFSETEDEGYLTIASQFISMAANKSISLDKVTSLTQSLNTLKYWMDLGFQKRVAKASILKRLDEISKMKKARGHKKLSEAKRTLISLLLNYNDGQSVDAQLLVKVYNGLLYPRVKTINKKRVDAVLKR